MRPQLINFVLVLAILSKFIYAAELSFPPPSTSGNATCQDWSCLGGIPAGFADNTDDGGFSNRTDIHVDTLNVTNNLTAGSIRAGTAAQSYVAESSTSDQFAFTYVFTNAVNTDTFTMEKQAAAGQPQATFIRARANGAAVQNADATGLFVFRGSDGTRRIGSAAFGGRVIGSVSAGKVPMRLEFLTTETNSTGLTSRMNVQPNGSIGMGTATPAALRLHIAQTTEGNTLRIDDGTEICDIDPDAGGLTTTCSSDSSLKENIRNASSKIDDIMSINIREYEITKSGETKIGPIAQEVAITNPELVTTMKNKREINCVTTFEDGIPNKICDIIVDEHLGVKMDGPFSNYALIKAIQEQQRQIERLEARIATLEKPLAFQAWDSVVEWTGPIIKSFSGG